MGAAGSKLGRLIPQSIVARGLLLVVVVATVVAVPGYIAHSLIINEQSETPRSAA